MKPALVRHYGDSLSIEEVPKPTPGEFQVLVRIIASGLCHTDIHAIDADWPVKPKLPLVPGHEGVGIVEVVGSSVTNIRVGDRVGIAWLHLACGECNFCLQGKETLCPHQETTGYSVDGCFAEYVLAQASHVARIPEQLDSTQAAPILCAGVTTYKALKETEVKPGQFITIIGAAGGLGHLAIQYATAMGMRVVAVDMPEKLDFFLNIGAEHAFNALDPLLAKRVTECTCEGSHGVLCVAATSGAFDAAINLCRRGGTIVLVGLPKGYLPLPVFDCVLRGITIRGSIVGTRSDLSEALDFCARGKVKCQIETCTFEDVQTAVDKLRTGQFTGRCVLCW